MDPKLIIRHFLSPDQPKLDPKKLGFDPYAELTRVKIAISTKMPFFGHFVVSYPSIVMAPDHPLIDTAAADGKHFFFNALFMHLLNPTGLAKDNDAQVFVYCHEIMHVVFDSLGRRGSRDPQLWNVATDYIINQTLMDAGLKMPETSKVNEAIAQVKKQISSEYKDDIEMLEAAFGVSKAPYVGLYDERFANMTAEQVYEILKEEDDKKQKECQQMGGGGQGNSGEGAGGNLHKDAKTLDVHIIDELDEDEQKEVARSARNSTLQAANQARQSDPTNARGTIPAGVQRLIGEWRKPKVPWSDLIVSELDSLRISDYSPIRVDSRMFSQGVTLEGVEHETTCKIGVIADTSGSIGPDDLKKVLGELYGIVNQFDSYEIDVISCDTRVYGHEHYDIENGDEITQYPFQGGGGTLFHPAFEWMKAQQEENGDPYDAIIFFTDGYGEGWCEDHQSWIKKMIWVIVENWGTPPTPSWGTPIFYDQYE
jgi:predicted metal-dependent peptidase